MTKRTIILIALIVFGTTPYLYAQGTGQNRSNPTGSRSSRMEEEGLAQPFKGITTNGTVVNNLFPIKSTGASTAEMIETAEAFLSTLSEDQRAKTLFSIDDPEWRKWMNQHFYVRQGVGFDEMSSAQREAAFDMIGSALSAKGLKLSKDIMKLNHTLGELKDNFSEYGEWLYWITIMGTPSADEPWGWQIDGHHLIINCFVLGDQVVMTPYFTGSEPVWASAGKFKGTKILEEQTQLGLMMINALSDSQRKEAIIDSQKSGTNNLTEAYKDNVILDYSGIPEKNMELDQQKLLWDLIASYINNMHPERAKIKMAEIETYIDQTYFSWIGDIDEEAVFYYRIQSPVILIEFDHQRPAGLRHLYPPGIPNHQHVHTVVRTPNGNDYGKDLLRQHHESHKH